MGEAHPVQRCLRDTADGGGGFDPEHVEHRGHHVDDVRVLLADLAARGDACGPVHEERVARAAAVGFPLPAAERRVAGPGPAPRVVVERGRPAELVDLGQAVLQRLGGVVEELGLVGGAGGPALGARTVVGDHHDQRVVQLAGLAQELQQPPDLGVGVGQEAREDLHQPGGEPARVGRERLPFGDVGVVPRQFGVGGNDPELLLAGEHLLAVGVPALVEAPGVPVGPLLRHMVRGVRRAGAEVQVERLVRGHLLGVGDERDGVIGQVLGQVIALRSGCAAAPPDGCRRPARDTTGWCRRRGTRRSGRSRAPAASGRRARRRTPARTASDATCRSCRCCSRAAAASRTGTRSRTGCCRHSPGSRWPAR